MKVAALRALLAALPDDLLVTLNGSHVEFVHREHDRTGPALRSVPHVCDCGHQHTTYEGEPRVTWPGSVNIGRTIRPYSRLEQEPPVRFSGRWTAAARAAIDAHSDDPDAAP